MSKTAAFMGMPALRNLVSDSIAIDMGSATTVISIRGRGLVVLTGCGQPADDNAAFYCPADDTIYVADSESGPDTGANERPGIKKGIRIGSARDGTVTAFIEDMESTAPDHSGAEGVGVDASGNVYGAVVRRQMLERHVK